ncbi:MAG: tetratricopeptide repeat protein [Pirellulales bacterium]
MNGDEAPRTPPPLPPIFELRPRPFTPPAARPRGGPRWIVWIVAAFLLMAAGAGMGAIVYFATAQQRPIAAKRTPVEQRAEVVRVLTEYDASADLSAILTPDNWKEHQAVAAMLGQGENALERKDQTAFRRHFDFHRFFRVIEESGAMRSLSSAERRLYRRELADAITFDTSCPKLTLLAMMPAADGFQTRVAYAVARDELMQEEIELRLWLSNDQDEWKIVDWQRLDLGLTKTGWFIDTVRNASHPSNDAVDRWSDLMGECRQHRDSGDTKAAAVALRAAEKEPVPAARRDMLLVIVGYNWQQLGEYDEALRVYDLVQQPDDTPGAYFGRMVCCQWSDPNRAVASAEQYEKVIGPTLNLCQIKAAALRRLNRREAAALEWQHVLRFSPEDRTALAESLLLLPVDQRAEFFTRIDKLRNATAVAADLASRLSYRDFSAAAELTAYVVNRDPASPRTAALLAQGAERDEEYEQAAEYYRTALQRAPNAEDRTQYASQLQLALANAGKAVEAYETAADQQAAFENLAYYHDEGDVEITQQEFQSLLTLHRQRHPDDAEGLRRWANQLIEEERFDEAEQALTAALATAGEEDPQGLRYTLSTILLKRKTALEAFEALGSRKEVFPSLASQVESQDRWDELQPLLDAYKLIQDDDPQGHYHAGLLAQHEQRLHAALERFRRAVELASEEEGWMYDVAWQDAAVALGNWLAYYQHGTDRGQKFDQLASRFRRSENWEELDRLLALYRQEFPDDPRPGLQQAEAAWQRQQYAECADLCAAALLQTNSGGGISSWQLDQLRQKRLSSLLRLKRFEEAQAWAQEDYRGSHDSANLAIVCALSGDTEGALRHAIQFAQQEESAARLYNNLEAGPLFMGEAFRELHQQHPPAVPGEGDYSSTATVLFGGIAQDIDAPTSPRPARIAG